MEKTALKELIERIEVAYQRGDKKYKPAFDYWLKEARNLLEKEKQQIVDAYDEGIERNLSFKSGDEFYTTTYTH